MFPTLPIIQTNVWDAVWAIPLILLTLLLLKMFVGLRASWLSAVATGMGLIISIFISHPGNLAAGIFMGLFYGGAVVGVIYSFRNSFIAFREG